jgi:hypothetical protein
MIQVTLSGAVRAPDITLELPHVRIFGGAVWDRLELGVIAKYVDGRWVHRAAAYQWMLFDGDFRLLFGLIRDPSPISDPLHVLTVCGPIMYLNDVPFAEYVPTVEMWRGTKESRLWWPSFHLITADFMPADCYATETTTSDDRGAADFTARAGSLPPRSG